MMEQHHSPESDPNFVRNPTPDLTVFQAHIDSYLDRVCLPFAGTLSADEAAEQRAEMRTHLEALVTAHLELGCSEAEAISLALEQFGKEHNVARFWKQECEETRVEAGRGTVWSAIRPVVGYTTLNWCVYPALLAMHAFVVNGLLLSGSVVADQLSLGVLTLIVSEFTLFPAFLGFILGRRARGKILAASLLALPCIVVLGGSLAVKAYQSIGFFLPPSGTGAYPTTIQYVLNYGGSFAFGALGAGAALLQRKRTARLAGSR
jgi:hypothetical protein